jgi:hypothetical protein
MKSIVTVIAVASLAVAASAADAATLSIGSFQDWSVRGIAAIYLDGDADNGNFDTITFSARPQSVVHVQLISAGTVISELIFPFFQPISLSPFANQNSGLSAGVPRPAGQTFTYINRLLHADPLKFPGGLGWVVFGLVNRPDELSFVTGPLGGRIDTAGQPDGRLFLANIYAPISEPASGSLCVVGLFGLAARVIRRAPQPCRQC